MPFCSYLYDMSLVSADKRTSVCCSICNCLGYCAKRNHGEVHRPKLTILADRSFEDFKISALQGCHFCDVTMQAFQLLQSVEFGAQVELLLYAQSPTELHSVANKGEYDVVEIYTCPSKPNPLELQHKYQQLSSCHVADTTHPYPRMGNDVSRTSSLEASSHFLQENYYRCITDHEHCRQGSTYLPKRVVDISNSQYRLVEQTVRTRGVYAALSYTWGNRGFAMTTSENFEELKHGFDQRTLPVGFQDAAAMAQSLGIRYLWIDTLCIIQDSNEDWEEQAAKMGEIFEDAAIIIAASSSPDPYHTLFNTRSPCYQEIELFSEAEKGFFDVNFKARRKITRGFHAKIGRSTDINMDPLDGRAWGLQEKLLSTRLIAFTGAELQWTCRTLKRCECHQNPYPSQLLFPTPVGLSDTEKIMKYSKYWSQVIEEYSNRKLKFAGDRLPALSGLARKFEAVTGYTYIAGLWEQSLLYDLVWQRDAEFPLPVVLSNWLSPTFSWAFVSGPVNFRLARHSYPGSRIQHAEVVEVGYRTTSKDMDIKAGPASVKIRGYTVAAHLRTSSENSQAYAICIDDVVYLPNADQRAICEFSIDRFLPHYNGKKSTEGSKRMSCTTFGNTQCVQEPIILLSLYSILHQKYLYQNFLILMKSHDDFSTYERIGVGSGKMYHRSGSEADIPSEARLVRPFEWLSVDLEKKGRSVGNMVEEVMCIQ
jgi:hypothetical protein